MKKQAEEYETQGKQIEETTKVHIANIKTTIKKLANELGVDASLLDGYRDMALSKPGQQSPKGNIVTRVTTLEEFLEKGMHYPDLS